MLFKKIKLNNLFLIISVLEIVFFLLIEMYEYSSYVQAVNLGLPRPEDSMGTKESLQMVFMYSSIVNIVYIVSTFIIFTLLILKKELKSIYTFNLLIGSFFEVFYLYLLVCGLANIKFIGTDNQYSGIFGITYTFINLVFIAGNVMLLLHNKIYVNKTKDLTLFTSIFLLVIGILSIVLGLFFAIRFLMLKLTIMCIILSISGILNIFLATQVYLANRKSSKSTEVGE